MTKENIYELVGGPQDGGKVTGQAMPLVIFVGPKWLGDGFVSWGTERCERFPIMYWRPRHSRKYTSLKRS